MNSCFKAISASLLLTVVALVAIEQANADVKHTRLHCKYDEENPVLISNQIFLDVLRADKDGTTTFRCTQECQYRAPVISAEYKPPCEHGPAEIGEGKMKVKFLWTDATSACENMSAGVNSIPGAIKQGLGNPKTFASVDCASLDKEGWASLREKQEQLAKYDKDLDEIEREIQRLERAGEKEKAEIQRNRYSQVENLRINLAAEIETLVESIRKQCAEDIQKKCEEHHQPPREGAKSACQINAEKNMKTAHTFKVFCALEVQEPIVGDAIQ